MLKPDTLAMTAALALLTALGPLSTDMYLPSLPGLARDLKASVAGGQLTLSIFLIGFALGQFVYGPLSDRLGRKPVLLSGLSIFIAASAICTFAPTIEFLVAGRFAQALGASGPIVLARAMVRDLYEGPRAGRELSRMGTIMGVVPALAPILGGVLNEVAGWRANFLATLLFGLGLAALVHVRLPETIRTRSPDPLSITAMLRGFGVLLRHPGYRVAIALAALTYAGLFAFISGSSFVLQGVYGLSEMAFALSFALMVAGFIAGTLAAQRLVGQRGLQATMAVGVTCLALGGGVMLALVAGGAPSSFALTLPMALYAGGVGLTLPQATAFAMAPFPDRAGAASSLLGIAQMSFAALVGVGLGRVLEESALSLPIVIAGTGLSALALFAATGRARRT